MNINGPLYKSGRRFYREALETLTATGVPFLVGGTFALESYTGLARRTKDLDIFVRPGDCDRMLTILRTKGYRTELRFPHWLGKAYKGGRFIDVIFSSGNGLCAVDDLWFKHARPVEMFGVKTQVTPPEETIWSKAFVMERDRYDGADIAHLLRAQAKSLDWARLLSRFHRHWRVLFSHVILFSFVYPGHRLQVPSWFMEEMIRRLQREMHSLPVERSVCQGTLLSWAQYLVHVERGEYEDARHMPHGSLTWQETRHMTDVLKQEKRLVKVVGTDE